MKRFTGILKLNVLIVLLIGCLPLQKIYSVKRTVITGSVKNMSVYPTVKEISVQIMDFRGKDTEYTGKIKRDGTFKIAFDMYIAQDIDVSPIVGKILAHPGDTIKLYIDFKNIGTIKFGGDAQRANRELYKYLNSNYSFENSYPSNNLTLELHKAKCDSILNLGLKKQNAFVRDVKPCNEVQQWTKNYVYIRYYKALLNFPIIYASKNKLVVNEWLPTLQYKYYSFIDSIETIYDNKLINSESYELLGWYANTIYALHGKDTFHNDNANISVMIDLIKNCKSEIFKQLFIGDLFYSAFYQNNPELYEKNKDAFSNNIREPFIKLPLEYFYTTLKTNILNPKTASDAIFAKMYNKTGDNVLETIVKENKGKVIYIDFWSTGCGPCIAEFPNSKKLMEQYSGKDAKFVFICFGADKDKGEKIFAREGLGGDHYYLNSGQISTLQKGLKINAIPHYVLINKQGQITESSTYLRPIDPKTTQKIDSLLNQK